MTANVEFQEADAERRVESVALSHLSIELGHVYAEDFGPGNDHLHRHFERVAIWTEMIRRDCEAQLPRGVRPRISTCFLIDDYYNRFGRPAEVIQVLRETAAAHGVVIDYMAREAGCAVADSVPVARLVENRLVADPPPDTTGGRPPATESGWVCNGERTPGGTAPAMKAPPKWSPPTENGANQHSIFGDIQLWSDEGERRLWSCSFLASVWQLSRLGLLRYEGGVAVRPFRLDLDNYEFPDDWDELPAVMQINHRAAPFTAYRTMSVLHIRFLPVEFAVRTILSQVSIDPGVSEQLAKRSSDEGIQLPDELIDRIGYVLMNA
jgi:hypothetical protein